MKTWTGRWVQAALIVGVWAAFSGITHADPPPRWGQLEPGPYQAAFQSSWELDHSRTYNTTFADQTAYAQGKAPRPILINLWYPTSDRKAAGWMPHEGYFDLPKGEPRLHKLAEALSAYNRDVFSQEVIGKPRSAMSEAEQRFLEQLLKTPTACLRGAVPAAGPFPLVIYHAGFGSSMEDNAVLCEFLASHGYVVLGSAFQEPTGQSFNVDGGSTSARDLAFLIAYARRLPFVNWERIGLIGHSGGAHAVLMFHAQENSPVDAVVSLDTTQDYYSLADLRWSRYAPAMIAGRKHFKGPLLAAANPYAFFQLFDSLDQSRRYYLTLRDLEHNDFISQGGLHQRWLVQKAANTMGQVTGQAHEKLAKEKARLTEIDSSYESLNRYLLQFLDAHLKDDAAALQGLLDAKWTAKLGGAAPHVEYVPEGTTAPPQYREGDAGWPTPRQIRPFLRAHGVEKTAALLRRLHREEPSHPTMHRLFFYALVYELLDQGKTAEGLAMAKLAREVHPAFHDLFLASGKTYGSLGRVEYAVKCFQMALTIEPGHPEAARSLRELENKRDR